MIRSGAVQRFRLRLRGVILSSTSSQSPRCPFSSVVPDEKSEAQRTVQGTGLSVAKAELQSILLVCGPGARA